MSRLLYQLQGQTTAKDDARHIQALLASCPKLEIGGKVYLRQDEFRGMLHNLQQAYRTGDFYLINQPRGLKTDKVADAEEFIESREYFGLKAEIRPAVKNQLLDFFESGHLYIEAVCTGAIGTGKTFFAIAGLGYDLYKLSLLRNPQAEFGFPPGSSIYFTIQSLSAQLAQRGAFNEFVERVRNSSYFNNNFMYNKKIESELRFPNNIYVTPFAGDDRKCVSLNVMGGIIDEVNKMIRTENSVNIRFTGEEEFNQAKKINDTLSRRMKNRFQKLGRLPGHLYILGSAEYAGDFTTRKKEEAETDPTIFVMEMPIWESLGFEKGKPNEYFSGETFRVEIGSDYRRASILEEGEEPYDEGNVIEVPLELKGNFERDPEGALKDDGGITTAIRHRFIPLTTIDRAMELYDALYGKRSIFLQDQVSMGLGEKAPLSFEEIVDLEFIQEGILNPTGTFIDGSYITNPFAVSLDIASSKDAFGLAISRIAGYQQGKSFQIYDDRAKGFKEVENLQMPVIENLGSLKIVRGRGNEVDLGRVQDLIFRLKQYLNLKWFTSDSFQHIMMLQGFKKAGFRAGTLSVDADVAPYLELCSALKDGRYLFKNAILKKELQELERQGDVIDHPTGGSKDVADPAAASYFILLRKEAQVFKKRHRGSQVSSQRVTQQITEQPRRKLRLR